MPAFTKLGSMLRDGPVFEEIRSVVNDDAGFGLPHTQFLGIDRSVKSVLGEDRVAGQHARIERSLSANPLDESVVVFTGRPSLLVQGDSFELPPLRTWRARLLASKSRLEAALPSAGRVELASSDAGYVGTGWMIADRHIITNRHVAERFATATRRGGGFVIANDLSGRPYEVRLDFHEEFQGFRAPFEVAVKSIVHIESPATRPDLAVLLLATGAMLPEPLELGDDPEPGQYVATIGYPARDPDIPLDVAQRILGNVYDVKRLAPGQVIKSTDGEPAWSFSHDCTTLGGNSGAVVVDLETGKAVGLHFAGTYRTANYAVRPSQIKRSLAKKAITLPGRSSITPRSPATARRDAPRSTGPKAAAYRDRAGYDPAFLGETKAWTVALPGLGSHRGEPAIVAGTAADHELRYEHFSVVQHAARRLPLFTAVNIVGVDLHRLPRSSDLWNYDPRIARSEQVGAELYEGNDYDRGHMVRRLDPVWGDGAEVANADTFHWTNCTPQLHELNTKTWSDLEDYVLDNAGAHELKVSVFTGPVLDPSDPEYRSIRIPQQYWKIVAFRRTDTNRLSITGYMLSQANLRQPFTREAPFTFGAFRTYQVPIATIAARTGLTLTAHAKHDPLRKQPASRAAVGDPALPIDHVEQIVL